jgi:hypothetical protein
MGCLQTHATRISSHWMKILRSFFIFNLQTGAANKRLHHGAHRRQHQPTRRWCRTSPDPPHRSNPVVHRQRRHQITLASIHVCSLRAVVTAASNPARASRAARHALAHPTRRPGEECLRACSMRRPRAAASAA